MTTVIRKAKHAAQMDMASFCRASRLHPTNAYRLEAGKTPAGPKVRAKVADALGCLESELFDESGWPLVVEECNG